MNPAMSRILFRSILTGLLLANSIAELGAASPAEVKAAITKGVGFLRTTVSAEGGAYGEKILMALALYKGGLAKESAEIKMAVGLVMNDFKGDVYDPGQTDHAPYIAGVSATLLSDLDSEKYQPHLQKIADWFASEQMDTGGWDYPEMGTEETRLEIPA